ncbi:MAG: protein kinase domain-containing protein [Sphingobacteriales bacterium]|jgi:serine/threonine protein kinase
MVNIKYSKNSFLDLEIGDRVSIKGYDYIVADQARGGMGRILMMEREREHQAGVLPFRIALKSILECKSDESGSSLFKRELTVWAGLQHPFILPLETIVYDEEVGWIAVMERCIGTLRDTINSQKTINPDSSTYIIRCLAMALEYAEKKEGVLHLDIKPENILYKYDGFWLMRTNNLHEDAIEQNRFMLSDWGISSIKRNKLAALIDKNKINQVQAETFNNLGTILYMAPERFIAGCPSSRQSDIFSLGMVYLEMLVGMLPFRQNIHPIESLITKLYLKDAELIMKQANCPRTIKKLIIQMIHPELSIRTSSYAELQKQLVKCSRKTTKLFELA